MGGVILPLLAVAVASSPEILLPPWPLSPDGEAVAVRGDAPLSAEGAEVERVAPGLWRVSPSPGAEAVVLLAGAARAVARVEPPPGDIAIAAAPAVFVKGRDASIALRLEVRRADGSADAGATAPVLSVSSGRIRELARAGEGLFRATYEPARTRHPEVAVLIALVPRCPTCPTPRAVGHAVLPLAAALDLPGTSEPGARTSVTVAGTSFGPAVADARGRFTVPVVVPPGAHQATAESVDETGNRRTTELDLHLPEVDRLACAAWPPAIPADGRAVADVWCVASEGDGTPAAGAALSLRSSRGAVEPFRPVRAALQRARFRAPVRGGGTTEHLAAAYPAGGAASRDELAVALATGAPAVVVPALAKEPVPVGATVRGEAVVRDARGDVVGMATAAGGARDGFVAPGRFLARGAAGAWTQEVAIAFRLPPASEVASLALRRGRDGWVAEARSVDARPAAGVTLRFASGARAVTDALGVARGPRGGEAETVEAENGARAAGWAGFDPPSSPVELATTLRIPLRPRSAVDVVAWLEGRALAWRVEDEGGNPLRGRRVTLRAAGVEAGRAEEGADGVSRAALGPGRGRVAIVDAETGVAAVVEIP